MTIKYSLIRSLDRVASLLRALGLHPVTRKCRNLVGRIFMEGITIEVNGHRLCGSIRDRAFLYKLMEGNFEPQTVELFLKTVKRSMVVLDVGAYIGYYTLLAAREVGPKGKVYAFEPDPDSYRLLEYNVRMNGFSNVIPVQKAMSNQTCRKNLYQHADDRSMSSLVPRGEHGKVIPVECTSVDKFLEEQKVDLVKVDVEGAELQTLQGMVRTIEKSAGMTMFVEFNPVALKESGSPPGELISEIRKIGFDCIIRLDEQRNSQGEFELCNLYCTRGGY